MAKTLALIHTNTSLVSVFAKISKEIMPDVKIFNIIDESLLNNTITAGKLTSATTWRLANYIKLAEEAGANAIMVTCSSLGPVVKAVQSFVNIPVMRVDQAMADKAVVMGSIIGVIATLSTTLEPTSELIKSRAILKGKNIKLLPILCNGAFNAFVSGDMEAHDKIVTEKIITLMRKVDIIVLAQASMSRVVDKLPKKDKNVHIISSPRLAMIWAKNIISELP